MYDFLFYKPIYNLIIFLSNHLVDLGTTIIVATLIIKILLYPLYKDQIKNQIATKKAQPELKAIQKKLKDKSLSKEERQRLAIEMMGIHKKHGVKPFGSILNLILQIFIIYTIYSIIYHSGFPKIQTEYLYSFVKAPENIKMSLWNWIADISKPSYILAILTAITQFIYMQVSMPDVKLSDLKNTGESKNLEDAMKPFQVYLKYGLPIMIFFILLGLSAALGIYWLVSNLFMIFQEYLVRNEKQELKTINNN